VHAPLSSGTLASSPTRERQHVRYSCERPSDTFEAGLARTPRLPTTQFGKYEALLPLSIETWPQSSNESSSRRSLPYSIAAPLTATADYPGELHGAQSTATVHGTVKRGGDGVSPPPRSSMHLTSRRTRASGRLGGRSRRGAIITLMAARRRGRIGRLTSGQMPAMQARGIAQSVANVFPAPHVAETAGRWRRSRAQVDTSERAASDPGGP
jgi:hypothetical protein